MVLARERRKEEARVLPAQRLGKEFLKAWALKVLGAGVLLG